MSLVCTPISPDISGTSREHRGRPKTSGGRAVCGLRVHHTLQRRQPAHWNTAGQDTTGGGITSPTRMHTIGGRTGKAGEKSNCRLSQQLELRWTALQNEDRGHPRAARGLGQARLAFPGSNLTTCPQLSTTARGQGPSGNPARQRSGSTAPLADTAETAGGRGLRTAAPAGRRTAASV